MAVFKRGKYWYVRFQVGGVQVKRSVGKGATRAQANEFETKIRRELVNARLGHAPERSIADAIARWLEGESTTHKDRTNDLQRAHAWEKHVAGKPLREAVQVAATASDEWIAAGLTPATVNRRIALLRRVCRLAHSKWGWLDQDISRQFVALPGERQRRRFLSRAQIMGLVRASSKALGDAILLSAYTGLRRGELLRLTRADAAGGCVTVRVAKSGKPRSVPVPKQATAVLKRLPIKLTAHQLDREFRKARKATGLVDVRWHDIRHTYGSWLAQSGANLTAIRDLMGHSTLAVTSRYAHLAPEHLRAAVRKLK